MTNDHLNIGVLVFPNMTSLDALGPFEVLARTPDSTCHLVWKTCEPFCGDTGLIVTPTISFADAPQFDVLVVPGGPGQNELMADEELFAFLRRQAQSAKWITSVCTGSLLLAAAGLLNGYKSTCHWLSLEFLRMFPVEVSEDRVVVDRNHASGGGVTSGLDFAFTMLGLLRGEEVAKRMQLFMEYDPAPPFRSGHPRVAQPETVQQVKELAQGMIAKRRAICVEAARRVDQSLR